MAIIHLFDNTVGPPGQDGGYTGSFDLGVAFVPSANVSCTGLRWYAVNTTVTDKPSAVNLWDGVAGSLIGSTGAVTHNGVVGWHTVNLPTPVTLTAGHRYVVSVTLPSGAHIGTISAVVVAPTPLVWDGAQPKVQSAYAGGGTYPTQDSGTYWWVDVEVDTAGGGTGGTGGSGITPDQMEAKLTAWFASTADNTHQTQLPWATKAAVDAAATNTSAVKTVTDRLGNLSNGAIAWLNNRSAQLTDLLNTISADAVTALNNLSTRITGNDGTGGSAFKGPSGRPMATTIEDVNAKLDALAAAVAACCDWLDGRVLNELKLSAPVTYTINGYGYLETLRNVHRISVGTVPAEVSSLDIGGHLWLPRFGWWAPVTAQGAVLERHYIDWHDQWLWPTPAGTIGIAFHLPLGVDATVYAYTPLAEP